MTVTGKWSIPRGAGPSRFSPRIVYFEPWQRHSNQKLTSHSCGTWQPRCGHLRHSARTERSASGSSSSTSAPGSVDRRADVALVLDQRLASRHVDEEEVCPGVEERLALGPSRLEGVDLVRGAEGDRGSEARGEVRPQEGEARAEELERQDAHAHAEHAAHEASTGHLAGRRPLDLAVRRVLGHRLKKSPSHGQTQFQPGPRKKEPMKVTSSPPIIRHRKKTHISLRSRAALYGDRSMYGIAASPSR